MDDGQVLLLLDGLDELNVTHRTRIRDEIVNLGRRLAKSKIIVSCRSGDFTQQMDGFSVVEICPLSDAQIVAIKERWIGTEDSGFMEHLKKVPYSDVTNRPLLLTQMLLIYKRYGYLPEQPSQVYKKLVNLLLEDWDSSRGIKRLSQYAGFDPRRKADFLAALSYYLTYNLQKNRFTQDDLVKAYLLVCDRFRLPPREAEDVAREIQTHTGLITLGPHDMYEFCHLSFQEYLCAEYLVRSTLVHQSVDYLAKNPAPLAVAVALASDPGSWLGSLVLGLKNVKGLDDAVVASFISRVLVEGPIFEVCEPLGFALILLFKEYKNKPLVSHQLMRIFQIEAAKKSMARALRWYVPKGTIGASEFTDVTKSGQLMQVFKVELPLEGAFPSRLIPDLKAYNINIIFAHG